jgi:hypothetical protein
MWLPIRRVAVPPAAVVAVLALGLSACGGGNPQSSGVANVGTTTSSTATGAASAHSTGATSAGQLRKDGVAFAKCMRAHGIANFPDPASSGGGLSFNMAGDAGMNGAQFQAAQAACRKYLPAGIMAPGASAGPSKAVLLKYAKCMRAHGVSNFPDPTKFPGGGWGFDLVGQTHTSPDFEAANARCKSRAYGGVKPCGGSRRSGFRARRC